MTPSEARRSAEPARELPLSSARLPLKLAHNSAQRPGSPASRYAQAALTRRGLLGVAGGLGIAALLSACSAGVETGAGTTGTGAGQAAPRALQRSLMGSAEATNVRVGLILGPPSMGLSQFLIDARDGNTFHSFDVEIVGVDFATLAARFNQGEFDIVTLPSNIGAVLANNNELKTEVEVISLGNLGVLYGVTTDQSIRGIEDLRGRRVYSIGQSGTPEYTISAVLAGYGLSSDVEMSYRATPFEVLNLLQEEPNAIAILPQPFVELAKTMVPGLHDPIDLTAAWDAMPTNTTGSQAVTTHALVNRAFLETHESAVIEYLQRVGDSVDFTLDHIDEAAAVQEELGTFLNNEVAAAALPFCSLVNLTGEVMYEALSGFLASIHQQQAAAIGGKLPANDFYYMPPLGALETELHLLQAGAPATEPRR